MKNSKVIAIGLTIILISISGCLGSFLENDASQESIDSLDRINSYEFNETINVDISPNQNTDGGFISNRTAINIQRKGEVNLTRKIFHVKGSENISNNSGTYELYLTNTSQYFLYEDEASGTEPIWIRRNFEGEIENIPDSVSILGFQRNILNTSQVNLSGETTLNGRSVLLLNVTPNEDKVKRLVKQTLEQSRPPRQLGVGWREFILPSGSDGSAMIESYSIKQWVSNETGFPIKTKMNVTVISEVEDDGSGQLRVTTRLNREISFMNYNERIDLETPSENIREYSEVFTRPGSNSGSP